MYDVYSRQEFVKIEVIQNVIPKSLNVWNLITGSTVIFVRRIFTNVLL